MEVPAGQDGIQQLLQAEQEAQMIVNKARQAKTERLRQAKEDAAREFSAYKKEKEDEFNKSIEYDANESQSAKSNMQKETDELVNKVHASTKANKNIVLDLLLKQVKSV
eukprot:jgi/Picre1/33873/NNA_001352.t1